MRKNLICSESSGSNANFFKRAPPLPLWERGLGGEGLIAHVAFRITYLELLPVAAVSCEERCPSLFTQSRHAIEHKSVLGVI